MSLIGVIMLMGLVAKNAILLLDCARKEEAQGVDREEALMHAGRVRLRPILMTTFALIAGMMPVAIGLGEGGEFYRPMAVAIIGGTITSTLLTLLVVPSFYDSIEIARERAAAKFRARAAYGNPLVAFLITHLEKLWPPFSSFRFFYRVVRAGLGLNTPAEHPVERAARLVGFQVPPGFVARPKRWQHSGFRRDEAFVEFGAGASGSGRHAGDSRFRSDSAGAEAALEADQGELRSIPCRADVMSARHRFHPSVRDLQPLLRGHADLAGTGALRAVEQRRKHGNRIDAHRVGRRSVVPRELDLRRLRRAERAAGRVAVAVPGGPLEAAIRERALLRGRRHVRRVAGQQDVLDVEAADGAGVLRVGHIGLVVAERREHAEEHAALDLHRATFGRDRGVRGDAEVVGRVQRRGRASGSPTRCRRAWPSRCARSNCRRTGSRHARRRRAAAACGPAGPGRDCDAASPCR